MIDYDILAKYNTTRKRIRTIFTAKDKELTPDGEDLLKNIIKSREAALPDGESISKQDEKKLRWKLINNLKNSRKEWEDKLRDRIDQAIIWNLKNYKYHLTADMAWDGTPIIPETIPLSLFAQGKIEKNECIKKLKDAVGSEESKKFFITDPDDPNKIKDIDIPRLHEVSINLVRPTITRKIATPSSKYRNLYPFLKYDSRSTSRVGKLRADAMSQYSEIMTDQYGYRHEIEQWIRQELLHTNCLVFTASAWDRKKGIRKKYAADGEDWTEEEYVKKEGLKLIYPHPTRRFYDQSHPLSSINTDSGVSYLGFWDIVRAGEIMSNPSYFNTDEIRYDKRLGSKLSGHKSFFDYYYPDKVLNAQPKSGLGKYAAKNDRKLNFSNYTGRDSDTAVYHIEYREKIIPKDVGLGEYPHECWLRLVVTNNGVVVYGEILPTTPAFYMGYNEDDSRYLNLSLAHEAIPYQDQVSNFVSQILYLMKLESMLLLAVDVDLIDDKTREYFKDFVKGNTYHSDAKLVEYSSAKLRALRGSGIDKPFSFTTSGVESQISALLAGVRQIIQLMERNLLTSVQELGQFSPRETTASEVTAVNNTTTTMESYLSETIDEGLGALKRMIFESSMAKGSKEVTLPIINTYPDSIIKAAGFKPKDNEELSSADREAPELSESKTHTLIGSKRALLHDYIFNTRDGSERAISSQVALGLFNLLQPILQNELLLQAIGQDQVFAMVTEVFRLSGSGFTLKIPELDQQQLDGLAQLRDSISQALTAQDETNANLTEQIEELQNGLAQLISGTQGQGVSEQTILERN